MRVIIEGRRGCGRRHEEGIYLVSEPGGGELPLWNPVEPPIPYSGDHFRGWVEIDLAATLADREVILAGASAERKRDEDARAWEVERFGMPLQTRLRIGIGQGLTEEQLAQRLNGLSVAGRMMEGIGSSLRALGSKGIGRADGELARTWEYVQDGDAAGILACCWRISRLMPPRKLNEAKAYLAAIMALMGAPEDAIALRDGNG